MAVDLVTLARPYAKLAFEEAVAAGDVHSWRDFLCFLSEVLSEPDVLSVLSFPGETKRLICKQIIDIYQGSLSDCQRRFAELLVVRRFKCASKVYSLYMDFCRSHQGKVLVQVSTAYALSNDQRCWLIGCLEKRLGKVVEYVESIERSLIGGFVVRIADVVIDASICGQLQAMGRVLLA